MRHGSLLLSSLVVFICACGSEAVGDQADAGPPLDGETADGDVPAGADSPTSVTFAPQTVACPGVQTSGIAQNVVNVGTIALAMTAEQTAYVVSVMRVNAATIRSLFDNEVVCTGPGGWSKNMVIGQNVYEQGNAASQLGDITLTTRYLVHPGIAGTVTCKAYVRSASLGYPSATFRLVSGRLWFADPSVENAVSGQPVQDSVPSGLLRVDATTPTVRLPETGYFDLQPGHTGVSVIGDLEYMVCHTASSCNQSGFSQARFTLYVNQWKSDGSLCSSDSSTTVTKTIPYAVHHAYVPLNLPHFVVSTASGCIPRFNAYLKVDWLSGNSGAVQGVAGGLSDVASAPATQLHTADMSHIFVVPY